MTENKGRGKVTEKVVLAAVIVILVLAGVIWALMAKGIIGNGKMLGGKNEEIGSNDIGVGMDDGMMNLLDEKSGLEVVGGPNIDFSEVIGEAATESAGAGVVKVTGTVLNNSERTYSTVSIRFRVEAEDGTQLNDCVGERVGAELGPRQTWDYAADCAAGEMPARAFLEEMGYEE